MRHSDSRHHDGQDRLGTVSTVIAGIFAALVGILVGTITTFTHRESVAIGTAHVPWGLIVGYLIVIALVLGFRLVFASRLIGAAAAFGAILASAVLALPGAGGSVLVVNDAIGYLWAFGPLVLSAAVLAWPRPGARGLRHKMGS